MKMWWVVVAVVLAASACKKSDDAAIRKKYAAAKAAACACPDFACEDKVQADAEKIANWRKAGPYNELFNEVARCGDKVYRVGKDFTFAQASQYFSDRACACTDAACMNTVEADRLRWSDLASANSLALGTDADRATEAQSDRLYSVCSRHAQGLLADEDFAAEKDKAMAPPAESETPLRNLHDSVIDVMTKFTDRACACTTRDCFDKVNEALTEWTVKYASKASEEGPASDAQNAKIAELGKRYNDCLAKLP